ncbi:MAG: DUF885 domain-containing protein [candidate division Zixibacteria bacterium]|jgi:uncharacterized protein (DUF885 family)|nr:DUF885 domain-containing protein [candidate division Zixibacteria bacterium]
MVRFLKCGILLILLTAVLHSPPLLAENAAFTKLGGQILTDLQAFDPVKATQMGIHTYDARLADYSSKSIRAQISRLKDHHKSLRRFNSSNLDSHELINFRLLESNLNIALLDLDKIRWYERSPQMYVDQAVDGVYSLVLSQHAPLSNRLFSIVERMKQVPELLRTAQKNIKRAPAVYIETTRQSLEGGIDFYQQVAGELMKQFPEEADNILKHSTAAREAMTEFSAYLEGLERSDEHSFAIGKQNFDYMLSHGHLLGFDSDSLLRIGENLLAEVQAEYVDYLDFVENNRQNGQDSVFIPATFTRQDVLDYYAWEVNQVRVFLEMNDIVTIPADIAPVDVVQTPPFLRAMIGGIAYQPAGPFDAVQKGYFYIRPIPDELDRAQLDARYRYVHRRGFRGSVVHEAFPGHHLQMQLAGMSGDPVRKWQQNIMLIEGWALYCEEMVYHAGLYGDNDPATWLNILRGIRFRAARIIADVKLHTGQFTYDECVDWMIRTLDIDTEAGKEYVRTEVRRYTLTPTVQMSYLMGKVLIEQLRDAMMQRDGDAYSDNEFHDALLGQGSIPLPLLREALGL